jgi:hypothetical protein
VISGAESAADARRGARVSICFTEPQHSDSFQVYPWSSRECRLNRRDRPRCNDVKARRLAIRREIIRRAVPHCAIPVNAAEVRHHLSPRPIGATDWRLAIVGTGTAGGSFEAPLVMTAAACARLARLVSSRRSVTSTREDPVAFIISANIARRNLNKGQQAILLCKDLPGGPAWQEK